MTRLKDDDPKCQEALRAMYEFLDKELSTDRRAHVQTHLDECIPCLEAFEFEAELKQVIATKCREEVPDYLYSRVRMSLRAEIDGNGSQGGIPAL